MKTTLLAIALTVASMPLMFAQPTQAAPAGTTGSAAKPAAKSTAKHTTKKSSKKGTKHAAAATPNTAAKAATASAAVPVKK